MNRLTRRKGMYGNTYESPFKTSSSGMYSPQARAARHVKDEATIVAFNAARGEHEAAGKDGPVAPLPKHFKYAAQTKRVIRARHKASGWLGKRA